MPKPDPDAELVLHKLGQRIRQGFAKKHPVQEKTLETVKDAVREQYELERKAEREKKMEPELEKTKGMEPPEPDRDSDR